MSTVPSLAPAASTASPVTPPPTSSANATGDVRSARWRRGGLPIASLLLCLALWHLAATTRVNLGLITFANVPAPAEVPPFTPWS